jgi:transcription termination factor Rho
LCDKLAEKRVFPAIDLFKSGTRKEELLLTEQELATAIKLRSIMGNRPDATEIMIDLFKKTANNKDLTLRLDGIIKAFNK